MRAFRMQCLMAGQYKNNKKYIAAGLDSLEWLYEQLMEDNNKYISLIGNDGWLVKGQRKQSLISSL
jgi:hypothetical protein